MDIVIIIVSVYTALLLSTVWNLIIQGGLFRVRWLEIVINLKLF